MLNALVHEARIVYTLKLVLFHLLPESSGLVNPAHSRAIHENPRLDQAKNNCLLICSQFVPHTLDTTLIYLNEMLKVLKFGADMRCNSKFAL